MSDFLSNPATKAVAVTPSDTTDLRDSFNKQPPRGLYIGTAGDLVVVMAYDEGTETPVTFADAPAGYHPIRVRKVMAATAALDIVALG